MSQLAGNGTDTRSKYNNAVVHMSNNDLKTGHERRKSRARNSAHIYTPQANTDATQNNGDIF